MLILIDNGHGQETSGKCSPDRRLREYSYTRRVAAELSRRLTVAGFDTKLITPENDDIPLNQRVLRVNAWCAKLGAANVLLISIHCNASGADGKWHDANGWSVYVAQNASDASKRLASALYAEAAKRGLKGNRAVPPCHYWVQSLAVCRDTKCPAVLTENLFQDNSDDVDYLLSSKGFDQIVQLHVDGIKKYLR